MRTVRGIEISDGQPFTEDFSYVRGQHLHFEAKSYKKWMESLFPGSTKKGFEVGLGNGFMFQAYAMPVVTPRYVGWMFNYRRAGWEQALLQMPGDGSVSFDAQVNIPRLIHISYENLHSRPDVWMSLAPAEVYSQRAGVKRGKGNVLILGLGMGWMARRVLERKQVKHVTIVEKELSILEYFGLPLMEFGDRVDLVHGDAYEYGDPRLNKNYDYDIALWDIWGSYGDCGYDRKYHEIRALTPCWQWGTMAR